MKKAGLTSPKKISLGMSYSDLYNNYFSQFPTIVCFEYSQENLTPVLETCDNIGVSHRAMIFQLRFPTLLRPKLVWVIGFGSSKSEVDDKERIRISEGMKGLWKISTERLIDPNQEGFSFIYQDHLKYPGYLGGQQQPYNSSFYKNSYVVLYKEDQTYKSSQVLIDYLDKSIMNRMLRGFTHCKRILKNSETALTVGLIIYFNDPYELVYDQIQKLTKTIGIHRIEHPTTSISVALSASTNPQTIVDYVGYYQPQINVKYRGDPRNFRQMENFNRVIFSMKLGYYCAYMYVYLFDQEQDFGVSATFVQGQEDVEFSSLYTVIAEGFSPYDLSNLDDAVNSDNSLQLLSNEASYSNRSGKVYKNYGYYKLPELLLAFQKYTPILKGLKFYVPTTRMIIVGSTSRDKSYIQSLCSQNGIRAYVIGNLEQTVITNTLEDSIKLFRIIVQNTAFSVVFVENYRSAVSNSDKEETETVQEKMELTCEQSSEEESATIGEIKMKENGEITIKCGSKDDIFKILASFGGQGFKLDLEKKGSLCDQFGVFCQLKVKGEDIHVLDIIKACRRGKKIQIEN